MQMYILLFMRDALQCDSKNYTHVPFFILKSDGELPVRNLMRITCKLVEEETPKIRTTFLDKYPSMKKAHPLDDPNYAFMKLVGITSELGKKVYTVK